MPRRSISRFYLPRHARHREQATRRIWFAACAAVRTGQPDRTSSARRFSHTRVLSQRPSRQGRPGEGWPRRLALRICAAERDHRKPHAQALARVGLSAVWKVYRLRRTLCLERVSPRLRRFGICSRGRRRPAFGSAQKVLGTGRRGRLKRRSGIRKSYNEILRGRGTLFMRL
jgi:hypothetical protein